MTSLTSSIGCATARNSLALDLVQRLQSSEDLEFWESLVDVAHEANPGRGRLLGHLIGEAVDEDVTAANTHIAEWPR